MTQSKELMAIREFYVDLSTKASCKFTRFLGMQCNVQHIIPMLGNNKTTQYLNIFYGQSKAYFPCIKKKLFCLSTG